MLSSVEDWNLARLQEAIQPDQNKWLTLWMTHLADDSLKQLLRRLRFTESFVNLRVCSERLDSHDV